MNYSLALKLKEAGFPQNTTNYFFFNYENEPYLQSKEDWEFYEQEYGFLKKFEDIEKVSAPTLEELIEACGEDFMLTNECGNWEAWSTGNYKSVRMGEGGAKYECEGKTPIEAVAHLWLALNKPVA